MKKTEETFEIPERNISHSKKRSKDEITSFLEESEYLNKKRKQTNNIPQYLGDSYFTNFCEDEILYSDVIIDIEQEDIIEINDDESKIEKPVQENSETDGEIIQSQEARSNSTITKNSLRNSFVVSEVNELDDVAQRSHEKLMQKIYNRGSIINIEDYKEADYSSIPFIPKDLIRKDNSNI